MLRWVDNADLSSSWDCDGGGQFDDEHDEQPDIVEDEDDDEDEDEEDEAVDLRLPVVVVVVWFVCAVLLSRYIHIYF